MPIYEFACPRCRVIFNFLSKKVNPSHSPACPKCGSRRMHKQVSRFAHLKGLAEPAAKPADDEPMPDIDERKMERVMSELERDMDHLDENNPRHMAHVMKKMKDAMPPGLMPKELYTAIKRLERGEDPEKIEEDMGDVLGDFLGGPEGEDDEYGGYGGGGYTLDSGLYDY
jgi:putative FmdB family regulatory protein